MSCDPLLKFKNLLEQLTELREALFLLLPIYYKEYNLGTAKWKRPREQGMCEGAWSFHMSPSPHWDVFTNPDGLQTPFGYGVYGCFITL